MQTSLRDYLRMSKVQASRRGHDWDVADALAAVHDYLIDHRKTCSTDCCQHVTLG